MRSGVFLFVLALPLALGAQQQTQSVPDAPAPQSQSVPDAPAPQNQNGISDITSHVAPGQGSHAPDNDTAPASSGTPATDSVQQKPPYVPEQGQMQKDLPTFRANITFITVPTVVLDSKGQQVAGLHARDFQIYENNVREPIAFFSADPVPLSMALVIDQSVTQDVMKKVNDSLGALQGALTPADEVAVFTYSDGVNNPTDFTAAQGARLPAVLEASKKNGAYMDTPVNGGPFYGGPRVNGQSVDPNLEPQRENGGFGLIPKEVHTLNDAILAAAVSLSKRPEGRRRIIYVISDGKESRSKATFREVVKYLQGHEIAVYATLVGDSAIWGLGYLDKIKLPLLPLSPDNILPRYTSETGGVLYSEFSENGIQRSFAEIAALARTQYTLGFYSHIPPLNGNFRSIDVRVLRPDLTVKARRGYYPTATAMNR